MQPAEQPPYLLHIALLRMAEPKKEAYRAYLESAGVIEGLTKGTGVTVVVRGRQLSIGLKEFSIVCSPGQPVRGTRQTCQRR